MQANSKAIIIGPAFPLRGGIANFNEALCRSMNEAGISTKIISFSYQYPDFLFPGKTQFDEGKAPKDIQIETKISSINPSSWIKIAKQIKAEQPDFVVFRYWLPFMAPALGTIAKIIKRGTTIKVIAITDNVIPHERRIGDRQLTSYFVKQCNGFIAMSQSVLNDLSRFTKTTNKLFLPHPMYNIFGNKVEKQEAKKRLNLNESEHYILFFGFIRKYKGLDLLLEAMGDERIKKLNIKLIVAGEYYEDPNYYENIIERNQIKNQLVLKTEYIPSDEVRYYFCAADMVVQPYKTATQSGVTQIAYHFDIPMLVTNVGGLPEIVPHKKVGYVSELHPTSIANFIYDFYFNNREALFVENIKEEKKRFYWSSFVDGLCELVKKC